MSIEDKDRDDVMERLLELGGDKKYLTFDDLNRELPDNVVSPDDIEDVLQKLRDRPLALRSDLAGAGASVRLGDRQRAAGGEAARASHAQIQAVMGRAGDPQGRQDF